MFKKIKEDAVMWNTDENFSESFSKNMDRVIKRIRTIEKGYLWRFLKENDFYTLLKQFMGNKEMCMEYMANMLAFYISMYEYSEKVYGENDTLRIENHDLSRRLETAENTLKTMNQHHVQKQLIHNGKKLAYKKEVSCKKVKEMMDKGYTITEIAKEFNVSRSLIYRRIKEIKELLGNRKDDDTERAYSPTDMY